jgi:flagellar protein FliO/FliZ
MLLVKSKELKNLNKNNPSNARLAGLSFILASITPSFVQAQEDATSVTSMGSILSVFLSLIVVIAIILALAYVVRRFNVAQAGHGQMRVVASMMAGSKEKVMVIEVGGEQHLLGITAHNINHLAKLEQSISTDNKNQDNRNKANTSSTDSVNLSGSFQQKLVQAMAQTITGKGAKKDKQGPTNV